MTLAHGPLLTECVWVCVLQCCSFGWAILWMKRPPATATVLRTAWESRREEEGALFTKRHVVAPQSLSLSCTTRLTVATLCTGCCWFSFELVPPSNEDHSCRLLGSASNGRLLALPPLHYRHHLQLITVHFCAQHKHTPTSYPHLYWLSVLPVISRLSMVCSPMACLLPVSSTTLVIITQWRETQSAQERFKSLSLSMPTFTTRAESAGPASMKRISKC